MARTRSAANIAHAKARSGRSSVKRSEPPRRNRRKARDQTSSPPRRARTTRAPANKKKSAPKAKKRSPKKGRQQTRSLKQRGGGRSSGIPKVVLLVFAMMAVGFGAVWGLDAWARYSRPAPSARVHTDAPEAPEAPEAAEAGPGLQQLWDKFVDRLLDRDLPVRKKKPVLKAERPKPKPAPVAAQPKPTPKPDARAEVVAPPPKDYQQEAKPLEEAKQRAVKRDTTRRARLNAILDSVGVPGD